MSKFEDNLWREVEEKYGSELSGAPGPTHSPSRLHGPVLAGTSLGIVGAAAAAVVILTAASSPAAFAVTTQPDGTVSVVIRRIDGIPGANRRLAQLGIHARTVRVADGCQVLPAPGALKAVAVATLVRNGHTNWIGGTASTVKAEIRPAQIPSGRTLVIPAVRAGALVRLVRGRAVPGAVPACLPPAVQVRSLKGGVIQFIACRGGVPVRPVPGRIVVRPPASAPDSGTNTTLTNAGPPPATITETTVSPAVTTESFTTRSSTATDSGMTSTGTGSGTGTTPSSTPAGWANITFPPPLVRACRLARRAATR